MEVKEKLSNLQRAKGITLVVLVVTIIVLLILAGVSISILSNNSILDKSTLASTETLDAAMKENVELCITDTNMAYISEKNNIKKDEFFVKNIETYLQNLNELENIIVDIDENELISISFDFKNNKYNYIVSNYSKVEENKLINDGMRIGDYVEYPISYKDAYSNIAYSEEIAWKVLDDGKTSGTIKIISTGIPIKWFYNTQKYSSTEMAIEDLENNFSNLEFSDSEYDNIKGEEFMDPKYANKITTLNLSELNNAYNILTKSNRSQNDKSKLTTIDDCIYLSEKQAQYWILEGSNNKLNIMTNGYMYQTSDTRSGIRPVIYLKNNIDYKKENNVWKLKIQGE